MWEHLKERLVVHVRGPRQSFEAAIQEDLNLSEDEITKPGLQMDDTGRTFYVR